MTPDADIPTTPDAASDLDASTTQGSDAADALEGLSTQELHDRAIRRAEKHMDVKFFWTLLEAIPAAEALAGNIGEADFDIRSARGQIKDALHSGDGSLGEALRPLFVAYLRQHPDA
jgi:hypothetical protein